MTSSVSDITIPPLYITANLFMMIQKQYLPFVHLFYSPWKDCTNYKRFKVHNLQPSFLRKLILHFINTCIVSDFPNVRHFQPLQRTTAPDVIIPVFCLKLTHQLPLPLTVRLIFHLPIGYELF